jgi:hypothetical protein
LITAAAIVVLAVAVGAVLVLHHRPIARTGPSIAGLDIPASARASVRLLVSAHGRQALTPELNAFLPKGQLFPPGTTFTVRPGSWHQEGAYANVTGVLHIPGKSGVGAKIGLVHSRGRWLVTFEAGQ